MSQELLAGVERLHGGRALGHIEVERALAILLRKDEVGDLPLLLGISKLVMEKNQQQSQSGEALLTINDEFLAVLVADDD